VVPTSFPSIDLGRIEVEVEQDSRPLHQSTNEDMPAE
jgi:hypothetical protein